MNDMKLPSGRILLERLSFAESESKLDVPSQKTNTKTNFEVALSRAVNKHIPLSPMTPQLNTKGALLPLVSSPQKEDEENINERALGLHAYRLQLLASNIANADTPGYKAVDIDVNAALREGKSAGSPPSLLFSVPSQGSVDGNTVEMDVERVKYMQSALMYEYSVDRVRGHYKDMEDLLKNLPY